MTDPDLKAIQERAEAPRPKPVDGVARLWVQRYFEDIPMLLEALAEARAKLEAVKEERNAALGARDSIGGRYDDVVARMNEAHRQLAAVVEALGECQRLAVERIKTADAAVKKDVYAADALMGIATTARRTLADIPAAGAKLERAEKLAEALQTEYSCRLCVVEIDGDGNKQHEESCALREEGK
jgi:hypothetical protein